MSRRRELNRTSTETEFRRLLVVDSVVDTVVELDQTPSAGTVLCTFGAVPQGQKTAAKIITGFSSPEGQRPLKGIRTDRPVAADAVVRHKISGHFAVEKLPWK